MAQRRIEQAEVRRHTDHRGMRLDRRPLAYLPKYWTSTPIWPAKPSAQGIELPLSEEVEGKDGQRLVLGGGDFLDPQGKKIKACSLGVEHLEVLLSIIRHQDFFQKHKSGRIDVSLKELYRDLSGGKLPNARRRAKIRRMLRDLKSSWVRVEGRGGHRICVYEMMTLWAEHRLLADGEDGYETQLRHIVLQEDLWKALCDPALCRPIRFDVLTRLPTSAKSLYLFLPFKAWWKTDKDPFRVELTQLAKASEIYDPGRPAHRKRYFSKIAERLDKCELPSGILRVKVRGDALKAWVERKGASSLERGSSELKDSAVFQIARKAGWDERELLRRKSQKRELDDYEESLLDQAQIEDRERSMPFFCLMKSLLGESVFREELAEAKDFALRGGRPQKSYRARLIFYLIERLKIAAPG